MPYLIKVFDSRLGAADLQNIINDFLHKNYEQDKEFEPLDIQYLMGLHARLMYKCSETNPNYIEVKNKIK